MDIRADGSAAAQKLICHHALTFFFLDSFTKNYNFPKTALERLKDSLEIKKEMAKNYLTEHLKYQDYKDVNIISFDQYGNTIKMKQEQQTPAGKKEVFTIQLYRKQE